MKVPRKSLRGYEAKAVKESYQQLQLLHERRMAGLNEELLMLQEDNERLHVEVELLTAKLTPSETIHSDKPSYVEAAEDAMMAAHHEQTKRIGQLMAQLEALQEEQRQQLAEKEAQRTEVLARIQERLAHAFEQFQAKEG
ncbi:regulator of replication initiation timing [Paenibacillus phyllosphaerae]|uniref:Regulator of replication initiation timing n=1 Tax=Paenibacillus phyllosphaerae TaxID=274593 RepID=A0A7W5AUZ4_9BACL|nr:hypothetical protein [Paenibacillus phyllosphaerae]MBB3108751.1 regulator of replication initiation timing [Paenibacillus phyllosphaerae]